MENKIKNLKETIRDESLRDTPDLNMIRCLKSIESDGSVIDQYDYAANVARSFDREAFKNNRDTIFLIRPVIIGEYAGSYEPSKNDQVCVFKISDSLRVRIPMSWTDGAVGRDYVTKHQIIKFIIKSCKGGRCIFVSNESRKKMKHKVSRLKSLMKGNHIDDESLYSPIKDHVTPESIADHLTDYREHDNFIVTKHGVVFNASHLESVDVINDSLNRGK